MKNYLRLLSRLHNVPLLLDEPTLALLTSQVTDKLLMGVTLDSGVAEPTPKVTSGRDNVAIINVTDKLVNKPAFGESGFTKYSDIKKSSLDAIASGADTLGFYVGSPGGEFSGLFPVVQFIRELPEKYGVKTFSFSDDHAHSAAYAIFSATQKTYATPYTSLGSIAAIADLVNVVKADEMRGIKHHILRSKDDKALGNPHEEFSEELLAKIKIKLDKADDIFNNETVKNRPNLTIETIKNLKGDTFLGDEAKELGLVDVLVTDLEHAIALETKSNPTLTNTKGDNDMPVPTTLEEYKAALAAKEADFTALQGQLSTLKAETATALASGVADERKRCVAILKACTTLKLDASKAIIRMENGNSAEDSLDIFTAIAEGLGVSTAVDTSEGADAPVPPVTVTDKSPKLEVDGEIIQLSAVMNEVKAMAAAAGGNK